MHGNNDSTSRVTRTTAEGIAMDMAMVAVVGSEDRLSFDLLNGRMAVAGAAGAAPELLSRLEKAVARTGMRAEPWSEEAASPPPRRAAHSPG